MSRYSGRSLRRARRLLAAAVIGLLPAVLGTATPAQAQSDNIVPTEWGPLTDADKDLLVRVKQASLWVIPAGQMADERGADKRVREVGGLLEEELTELDQLTEETAEQLGVGLPDQALPEHQTYLNQLDGQSGEEFDVALVTALRETYSEVYPVIAYLRGGTQNALIREFTNVAEDTFNQQMDYLESTELVDWSQMPAPPEPAGRPTRFLAGGPAGVNPVFIWIILGAAAVAGTITVVRTVRPRPR